MAGDRDKNPNTGTVLKERQQTKRPPLYKVLFHNDDFTTMEFVVHVLKKFFDKDRTEATRIMLHIHHSGIGLVGLYPFEVAETLVQQASDYALANEYPLRITMEPDK